MIFWITGRKHSGKTTLAKRIAQQINAIIVDGDEIRGIFPDDFTEEGRERNQRRIAGLANLLDKQGFNVVIACVSPRLWLRKELQGQLRNCVEIELPFGTLWKGSVYEETLIE